MQHQTHTHTPYPGVFQFIKILQQQRFCYAQSQMLKQSEIFKSFCNTRMIAVELKFAPLRFANKCGSLVQRKQKQKKKKKLIPKLGTFMRMPKSDVKLHVNHLKT